MFATTQAVCGMAFGAGRGDAALLAVPVIPAVALVDVGAAAVQAVAGGVSWLRRRIGLAALAVAERCGVVPVASPAVYPVATVAAPVPVEAPAKLWSPEVVEECGDDAPLVLVMPSAAQETTAPAGDDLAAALAQHGSVRATAKALGIAESTLRGRLRKAGVKLPGRKAKG
jgi:hypothetical protein